MLKPMGTPQCDIKKIDDFKEEISNRYSNGEELFEEFKEGYWSDTINIHHFEYEFEKFYVELCNKSEKKHTHRRTLNIISDVKEPLIKIFDDLPNGEREVNDYNKGYLDGINICLSKIEEIENRIKKEVK